VRRSSAATRDYSCRSCLSRQSDFEALELVELEDFEELWELEELEAFELDSLLVLLDSLDSFDSFAPLSEPLLESFDVLPSDDPDELEPFVEDDDERESVMYQPLPLKTMPTGWMTLRSAPPHCSQVVRGESEKLWRFSITSLQLVQE